MNFKHDEYDKLEVQHQIDKAMTINGNGRTIDASNFTVAAAWYQDVYGTNEKYAYSGLYPDALIPLANYKFRRQDQIEKGRNQALYINFLSTKDMKPGKYKGTGVLTLDGVKYDIPFEVTIYDAEMPTAVHQKSCYLIWYEEIVKGELQNESPDMHQKYYDFALTKRLSPGALPDQYMNTAEAFAQAVYEKVANNEKVTNIRFPFTSSNFSKNAIREYLQKLVDKQLECIALGDTETDMFAKLMFYTDDEPGKDKYDAVKSHDKDVYDLKKELAPQLNGYPKLQESLMKIKHLCTVPFSESLIATEETGGVQCWCPQYQHFNTEANRQKYFERQKSTDRLCGEEVWWYGCTDPQSPYSSVHLDADLLTLRARRYMQFEYGIQGDIYWNFNYYSKYTMSGFTYARDVWHDPISWGHCAGDGQLYYPGVTYGIYGPITTLRLENLLATNEEYEYLWMIDQKVQEYNELKGKSLDTRELLTTYFRRLYKNVIAYLDDFEMNKVRIELLQVNEMLNKDLEAGINFLTK
mgnify:CR=1 FL=1